MTQTERNWLFGVVGGLACALGLLTCAGVIQVAVAISYLTPDDTLSAEHQQLIDDLWAGKFLKLGDIAPAPIQVHGPDEFRDPHPRARYYLDYNLPQARHLYIVVDENLRLVEYYFAES